MKAIIYSRVSTEIQDNARQVEELKAYANYRGFDIVRIFQEKVTGTSKALERKEFKLLVDYIEANKVDHILVWELSRLGRSMMDVLNTIELLSQRKVNIYIKKEGMNTLDDEGKKSTMTTMLVSILSGFAEMERETTRLRSISGIRKNIATGGAGQGNIKAYGYQALGKKLYVDPEEARIIRLIFNKYQSGLGTGSIAKYLNLKNIPTRFSKVYGEKQILRKSGFTKKGKDFKWVDGTIHSILRNSIYKGERKHRGEVFPIEPIVDAYTFDSVQIRLSENYNKNSSKIKYFNPLKNLLKCGHPECEGEGVNYYMHKRANNKDNAYKCLTKRLGRSCGNPSIGIDKLQKALFWICQPMIVNNALPKKSKHREATIEAIDNKRIQVDNTQKQLLDLNSKLDSLIRMNLDGLIDSKRFTELNSEILTKIASQNERLLIVTSELERSENLLKNRPSPGGYSRDIFNEYVKDAIDYIKIHPVVNTEIFSEYFPIANDVAVIVEVKSLLAFDNSESATAYFAISRYSGNLIFIGFQSVRADKVEQIRTGKYFVDFIISLDQIDYNKPFESTYPFLTTKLNRVTAKP